MFMPFDAHICFIKSMLIRNVHPHCPSLRSFVCIVEMKFVASPLIKSIKTKDIDIIATLRQVEEDIPNP